MSSELARRWVFDCLINSPALGDHVGNRIFSSGSLGIDPTVKLPGKPFLVYRAGLVTPREIRGKKLYPFSFYVHDDQGSYINHIEPALEIVEQLFYERSPEVWNGKQFFAADWDSTSEDLYDDMFNTAVRFATINVTV